MRLGMRRALLLTIATAVALVAGAPSASADTSCDRVASPNGSDAPPGTAAAPFRTLARLNAALQPGQTGCLRQGTWKETLYVKVPRVTIASWPGERATVEGPAAVSG